MKWFVTLTSFIFSRAADELPPIPPKPDAGNEAEYWNWVMKKLDHERLNTKEGKISFVLSNYFETFFPAFLTFSEDQS